MDAPAATDTARRLLILKYQVIVALATPPKDIIERTSQRWSNSERQSFRSKLQEKATDLCAAFKKMGLWDYLTPSEIEFFTTHPLDLNQRQMINASWRMEAARVLMWALKLIREFPQYDEKANHELLKQVPSEQTMQFVAEAQLQNVKTIEQQRSLAELWHWRSRTRKLSEVGDPMPMIGSYQSYDDIVRTVSKRAYKAGDLPLIIEEDFPVKGKAYRDVSETEWSIVSSIAVERHFALNWLCGFAPENQWDETPTDT